MAATEAQKKAIAKYDKSFDRINCRFPKGTKDRIADTGQSANQFIMAAVLEKLDQIEAKTAPE